MSNRKRDRKLIVLIAISGVIVAAMLFPLLTLRTLLHIHDPQQYALPLSTFHPLSVPKLSRISTSTRQFNRRNLPQIIVIIALENPHPAIVNLKNPVD